MNRRSIRSFVGVAAVAGLFTGALGERSSAFAKTVGTVVFDIGGVESKRGGHVRCALYRSEENWLGRTPYRADATLARGRGVRCVFRNLPRGTYAIASLHDEDDDLEMDKTLGLPTEGYCMSRDAEDESLLKPAWNDARFRFRGGKARVTATMNY
ncbi:MAG: DUF2141 domain-containing protein [Myxococcota bacterium]